jgi:hypothetical protein
MLQDKLPALSEICVENEKKNHILSFQDIITDFTLKIMKKSLVFKLICCANTVHLSFTSSSLHTNASTMLLFSPVPYVLSNVTFSQNNKHAFLLSSLGACKT